MRDWCARVTLCVYPEPSLGSQVHGVPREPKCDFYRYEFNSTDNTLLSAPAKYDHVASMRYPHAQREGRAKDVPKSPPEVHGGLIGPTALRAAKARGSAHGAFCSAGRHGVKRSYYRLTDPMTHDGTFERV